MSFTEKEKVAIIDGIREEHKIIERLYPESYREQAYNYNRIIESFKERSLLELIENSIVILSLAGSVCYIATLIYRGATATGF